jgi:Ca2+-binding EF-hand superfamily protein
MRAKIMQKCPPTQNEEGFLSKCFKFFDINNKGEVTYDQFYRTVEKIGVIIDKNV